MSEAKVFATVVEILAPYVKERQALERVSSDTNILDDLKINSARLVDVLIGFEDEFGIELTDDDLDGIVTIGDAVQAVRREIH